MKTMHYWLGLAAGLFLTPALGSWAVAQQPAAPAPKPPTQVQAQAPKPAAPTAAAPAQAPKTSPAAPAQAPAPKPPATPPAVPKGIDAPSDYIIGPDDQLMVIFWREKDLSAEAVVRPDGKITLPLINDIQAAGLTPDQLREAVQTAAARFVEDPNATVVIKQINSRKIFVTGMVNKPGPYPLSSPTTVLQAIALAGGLLEFAKGGDIVVMRTENSKTTTFKFNYKDVMKGKKLEQNILLKPGDTVVVP